MGDLAQVIDAVLVAPVICISSSDLLCMYLKSFKNFRANNAFLRGLLNTLDKNGRQRNCIKVQPNVSREKFFGMRFTLFFSFNFFECRMEKYAF